MAIRVPSNYGPWERGAHWEWRTEPGDCYRCGATGTFQWATRHGPARGACYGCDGTGKRGTQRVLWFSRDVPEEDRQEIAGLENERLAANRERARESKITKVEQKTALHREALEREYPGILEAFEVPHNIISDIAHRAYRFGSISPAQAELVFKLAREAQERAEQKAQWEQERLDTPPVPEGRHQVTGEVLSKKWQESAYGETLKMLVRDDRGWKVWGTVPTTLHAFHDDEGKLIALERGDRITFHATLEQSRDDPGFGFFKRPTKASRLNHNPWVC